MLQRAFTILGLGALCALAIGLVVGLIAGDAGLAGRVGSYVMIATAVVIAVDSGRAGGRRTGS